MPEDNGRLLDIILTEVQLNRQEIKELRKEIWALKTRFMLIAITMGVAGGKLGSILSIFS